MRAIKEASTDLSNKDTAFLKLAISLAGTSNCKQKHGAVIVRGGSVRATGVNKSRNDPAVFDNEYDVVRFAHRHAEFQAIKQLRHIVLPGATMYIARVNNQGLTRMSRPCGACYNLIDLYQIKQIIFTLDE